MLNNIEIKHIKHGIYRKGRESKEKTFTMPQYWFILLLCFEQTAVQIYFSQQPGWNQKGEVEGSGRICFCTLPSDCGTCSQRALLMPKGQKKNLLEEIMQRRRWLPSMISCIGTQGSLLKMYPEIMCVRVCSTDHALCV